MPLSDGYAMMAQFLPPPVQITYDVLPLVAFLALVGVAVGCYMFYAGNKVGSCWFSSRRRSPWKRTKFARLSSFQNAQKVTHHICNTSTTQQYRVLWSYLMTCAPPRM